MRKIYPFIRHEITATNAGEEWEFINEYVMALLVLDDLMTKENREVIYNAFREVLQTDNVLSIAKDKETDSIYIFEYDWHKEKPYTFKKGKGGVYYLLVEER